MPSEANELQLTDGTAIVIAHAAVGHPSGKLIDILGKAMPALHLGTQEGDRWSINVDIDHRPHPGWLRLCDCNRDNQMLVLMWIATDPHPDLTRGLDIIQRARCRRPFESPQSWPALPPGAKVP